MRSFHGIFNSFRGLKPRTDSKDCPGCLSYVVECDKSHQLTKETGPCGMGRSQEERDENILPTVQENNGLPADYEADLSIPGWQNELRRVVVKRHARYCINVVFLDFGVRRLTIKEIWIARWSTAWVTDPQPLPVWPAWMDDVPDP